MSIDHQDTVFFVVKNAQEHYSIWPNYRDIPEGWEDMGVQGNKETCLAHINKEWTDLRPKDLRDALAE